MKPVRKKEGACTNVKFAWKEENTIFLVYGRASDGPLKW